MAEKKEIPAHAILKFVLTSFLGARVDEVMDENGNMERCVCIPLDRNNLREGKTGKVSAYAFVNKSQNANQYGWTHYLKLKLDPNFVERINGLGYDVPYVGNLKPSNYIVFKKNYEEGLKAKSVKVKDYEL